MRLGHRGVVSNIAWRNAVYFDGTLASRLSVTPYANHPSHRTDIAVAMVSERNPADTSASVNTSSSSQRQPLANISAKMASNSPQNTPQKARQDPQLKPPTQPEFGVASPIRNPLRQAPVDPSVSRPKPRPTADPFLPRSKPVAPRAPESHSNGYYIPAVQSGPNAMVQPPFIPPEQRQFYMPGQPRPPTIAPAPRPVFSSLGNNTYFQAVVPKPRKNVVDLTNSDDDDQFDPDAAIRSDSKAFGSADPYMYVDSGQASENIKNLLEGAFDDDEEDRSKTRLRSRAKKAAKAEKSEADKQAQSLADRLAALNVKEKEEEKKERRTTSGG